MKFSRTIEKYYDDRGVYFLFKNIALGYQDIKSQIEKTVDNIFSDFGYHSDNINLYFAYTEKPSIEILIEEDVELNRNILESLDQFMGVNGAIKRYSEGIKIVYDISCIALSQSKLI